MFYLLQVNPLDPTAVGAAATLGGSSAITSAVAASWDSHWTNFFEGGLYTAVNQSMLGIALLFFAYSSVMTLIEWNNTGDDSNWNRLIAPLLVVAFLLNSGALTKTMILGVRAASNQVNANIIETLKTSQYYNDKLKSIVGTQQALSQIQSQITTCQSMADPTAKDICLKELNSLLKSKQTSGEIRNKTLLDQIAQASTNIDNAIAAGSAAGGGVAGVPGSVLGGVSGGLGTLVGGLGNFIGKYALAPATGAAVLFLMAMTSAVQNMVEGSMLLTSLLAPVYITAALLPDGKQSIIALCQSFWTIINYKLCYTIILGLTSQLLADDDGNQGLVLALISAVFAPILAGILAAGGGMGFANAAAGAASGAVSLATNIASGGATGSIASMIGSKLGGK